MRLNMGKVIAIHLEPDSPYFNPLVCGEHLTARINEFATPMALSAYWNQKKVQARLQAMPERWRNELWRRLQKRLEALNENGPMPI